MKLSKLDKIYNALVDWRVEEHKKIEDTCFTALSRYTQKKAIDDKFDRISEAINS